MHSPDPQESLVIQAGEEDPRCIYCDCFVEGCPKHTTPICEKCYSDEDQT